MTLTRTLRARWNSLAAREQRGLLLAAVVLGGALVWAVLLAPALRTLGQAQAQRAALGQDLAGMRVLQAQAQALQQQSALSPQEATAALQSATTALGAGATLAVAGDMATVTLKQVPADALASWLAQGRAGQAVEAHLLRDAGTGSWSGTLVFRLPGAGTP